MIIVAVILLIASCIYAAVRGLIVWAAKQPYEEDLWPTRGVGGPKAKYGVKQDEYEGL